MANEIFNVYADDSCSAESFVMSAPLDILITILNLRDGAVARIETESPCVLFGNNRPFLGRFNRIVVKAVR